MTISEEDAKRIAAAIVEAQGKKEEERWDDCEGLAELVNAAPHVAAPDLGTDWQGIAKALAEALRTVGRLTAVNMNYTAATTIAQGLALYDIAEARPTGSTK